MEIAESQCDDGSTLKSHKKSSRRGVGMIEIRANDSNAIPIVDGIKKESKFVRSEVYNIYQTYPCGLRTPEHCVTGVCRWIYPITFGGGMVGGDQVNLKYVIGDRCAVVVCTQDIPKVYHCLDSGETTQTVEYKLHQHCLLCVLPDPTVCYKDARFKQTQTIHVDPTSNLVLLDWLQAGRTALGESWQFQRCCSGIEIFMSGKRVLREWNDLGNTQFATIKECMGKFQLMGTCIILGPYLADLVRNMEDKYGCKKGFGEKNPSRLIVGVSPLSYCVNGGSIAGCYLRFLAVNMKAASVFIKDLTRPLLDDLGDDPFHNKI